MGSDTNFAPDIFVLRRATSTTQSHCTAGTTSGGCAATIRSTGVASATANSGFTLTLGGIDGQRAGLVCYGLSGVRASPWGMSSSWLCVKAPTQRMTTYDSGGTSGACDGSIVEDWSGFRSAHPGALRQPFLGGETARAQGWFRDPPSPKSTALSDGLIFSIAP